MRRLLSERNNRKRRTDCRKKYDSSSDEECYPNVIVVQGP
uniref:Uncharacterized protein n=1 Tax=viral metagenome TaxID=1070528 RepID=A0A6C0J0W5_9ZZZZ